METTQVTSLRVDHELTIERMTEHDLLEVVEIEQASGLSPWGWDAYHKELQSTNESMMLVARSLPGLSRANQSQPVIGFLVARQIADELHVNNVAVRPDSRRRGIAATLLRAALDWGTKRHARQAVLEVRAGNVAAQELYRRCGFQVVGRRRRYYRMPVEDALLMSVSLKQKP